MPFNNLALRMLAIIPALALAPTIVNAACLPSAPNGWNVPFTMTSHATSGLVSYTTGGTMTASFFLGKYSLTGDNYSQLFSDRFVPPPPNTFTYQRFDAGQADRVGLQISENILASPPTINMTLTLDTWGHTSYTFTGHCDASTNLLYGSVNKDTMVVVNFGTPFQPPQ